MLTSEKRFNEIFSNNLKSYLKKYGISQNELARRLDVSSAAVNLWCKGTSVPRMDKIDKMCKIFYCKRSDLMKDYSEYENIPTNIIKVLGSVPARIPLEAIEDVVDYEEIPEAWLNGDAQYFGLKVRGDSMYPKYMDGDTIICKKSDTCENGSDAVVFVNGFDATLKKVVSSGDNIVLQPLNPQYETKVYPSNEVKVCGVVVELRRKI